MQAPILPELNSSPQNEDIKNPADNRSRLGFRILAGTFLSLGLLAIWYTFLALQRQEPQVWILVYISWLAFTVCGLTLPRLIKSLTFRIFFALSVVSLALITTSALVEKTGPINGIIILIYSLLLASSVLTGIQSSAAINSGIILAVAASLIDVFSPFKQAQAPMIVISLGVSLVVLAALIGFLTIRKIVVFSIRIRLVTASLLAALIPIFILSFFQTGFMTESITNTTNQSLEFAASQTAEKFDQFLSSNQQAIIQDVTLSSFIDYLSLPPEKRPGSQAEANLRITIESLQKRPQPYLLSYGLLDAHGFNVFDTNPKAVGRFETFNAYFQNPLADGQTYVSSVVFSSTDEAPFIYFSGPIRDSEQKIIGVLRARYDANGLQKIAKENTGLIGDRSYPILVDEYSMRLADTLTPNFLYKTLMPLSAKTVQQLQDEKRLQLIPADQLHTQMADLENALKNSPDQPFFTATLPLDQPMQIGGAAAPMKEKPWTVMYVQEQAILAQLLRQQNQLTILIATVIAGLVSILATVLSRVLTQPIINLTKNAEKISGGDLNVTVPVIDRDEIGTLAIAFNLMTDKVRTLINELEDRVRSRTSELETQNRTLRYRTQQIQTVAEVARSIASAQDLEKLLTQIAATISERFGFYHVGIFLLDEAKEYAELRAANSDGGKKMLERHHKLPVGQVGIVGFATSTGKPRIALDVGEDATHFRNPDLPRTRSEMALPLITSGEIIGALDVQSEHRDAFTQEDINLFSTLADQVAIAIVNSRLYQETLSSLEESRQLHRQYLQQEWTKLASETPIIGYQYSSKRLTPLYTGTVKEDDYPPPVDNNSTVILEENGKQIAVLKIPITLRGEVIGTIDLKDEQGVSWDAEAVSTARAVADQISQALENARLFEQTQRRADRERKVLEITSRIRSTNDPETMLQIAATELQNALNARANIVSLRLTEQNIPENKNDNGHNTMEYGPGNG